VPNAIIRGSEIRVNALAKSINRDTRVSPDLEISRVMSSTIENHVGERDVSLRQTERRRERTERIITKRERERGVTENPWNDSLKRRNYSERNVFRTNDDDR